MNLSSKKPTLPNALENLKRSINMVELLLLRLRLKARSSRLMWARWRQKLN